MFYKAHTGIKSIPYEDMVREALCFGWIDSLIKRLDDDRYALKVTPRQPTSKWSDTNRKRWMALSAAGLLTRAGLAAAPTSNTYAPRPVIPNLPAYIAEALEANSKAWEFFRELAPTYRRDFVVCQTRENARKAHSGIDRTARSGKEARPEVDGCREEFSEGIRNNPPQAACRTTSTGLSHSEMVPTAEGRLAVWCPYRFPMQSVDQVMQAESGNKER